MWEEDQTSVALQMSVIFPALYSLSKKKSNKPSAIKPCSLLEFCVFPSSNESLFAGVNKRC